MVRKNFNNKSNDAGQNELMAQAVEHSDAPAVQSKRQWDCYLNAKPNKDSDETELLGAFEIKTGRAKATNNSYAMLSGFSKQHGGLTITLTKQVPKLIEKLIDAGFDEEICKVLEKKGILS